MSRKLKKFSKRSIWHQVAVVSVVFTQLMLVAPQVLGSPLNETSSDKQVKSELGSIEVLNECAQSKGSIAINVLFDVVYTKPEKSRKKMIFNLTCLLTDKTCSGATLKLDKNVISLWSMYGIIGAKLVVAKVNFFVVEWGPFRVINVDFAKGTASYRESGSGASLIEGTATSNCFNKSLN